MHANPALNAPENRRALVIAEVVASTHPQLRENISQGFAIGGRTLLYVNRNVDQANMILIGDDPRWNLSSRQNIIDETRGQGIPGHVLILCLLRILHDTNAAILFHSLHAHRTVSTRARKNYGNCT